MNKTLLAATALVALSSAATAADLPYRSAPASYGAAPIFTWAGPYVGVNAGALWASRTRPELYDASGLPFPGPISDSDSAGVSVGGTVGYNMQFGPNFVAGAEADLSWANLNRKSRLSSIDRPGGELTVTSAEFNNKLDYYGTLRGRLGVLAMPSLLLYATGGVAFADAKHSGLGTSVTADDDGVAFGSKSSTKWGYTLGAGMEYAIGNNLSVKGEYLYVGLSDTRYLMTDVADGAPMSSVKDHNDFSTVRVGLNYRFGGF